MRKLFFLATAVSFTLFCLPASRAATGFAVLHSFSGQTVGDGSLPQCTLVSDGTRLYGTTTYGGSSDYGTLFSILPDGSDYLVLHHFGSETYPAAIPSGSLVSDGSVLYGTARYGGSNGQGVVFSLQTDGTGYAELHSFTASTGDGMRPLVGVTGDGATLYGTTVWGGGNSWGTVFSLEPNVSGATVIHSFPASPEDGEWPYAAPLLDNGILYGTTLRGPEPATTPYPPGSDSGVVYSLQTDGGSYTILHTFGSQTDDGEGPLGTLLSDGTMLYGITAYGGTADYGTVFSLDPNTSSATLLHSFAALTGDGMLPTAGLVSDGTRLYGTTTGGGGAGGGYYYGGTIFALNKDGSGYTVLHDFSLQTEGGYWLIFSGLLLLDHTLYGTASRGGEHDYGVIFSYGLPPSPTPLTTPTPSATPTFSPTPKPSATPVPPLSPTPSPSATPAPTSSPSPAPSASPSPDPSPRPSPLLLVLASGDYNGDGKADIAVFRPAEGKWMVRGLGTTWYGRDGDLPVPGDYNGNGVADIGVYRPSSGLWAVKSLTRFYLAPGLIPAPADYDGGGTTNAAAFRPSDGLWTVREVTRVWFGQASDRPVPGDYNGDGSSEIAVWRPATGLWAIRGLTRKFYGLPDDIPVPGCYTWDGTRPKAQAAVYRPARGKWLVLDEPSLYYGSLNDVPMPGSYTGGVLDLPAVFRGAKGLWFIRGLTRAWFGRDGDYPVTR